MSPARVEGGARRAGGDRCAGAGSGRSADAGSPGDAGRSAGSGRSRHAGRQAILDWLAYERELGLRQIASVIGIDEVGRGALAGPLAVGATWNSDLTSSEPMPAGLRDSKRVPKAARLDLAQAVALWRPQHAVGYASPREIDERGLTAALGLAGARALARLPRAELILLDGAHDWVTPALLTANADPVFAGVPAVAGLHVVGPAVEETEFLSPGGHSAAGHHVGTPVTTLVGGDDRVAIISASSILAKVARDALMCALHDRYPVYGWADNMGYGTGAHRQALREHAVSAEHRRRFLRRMSLG